MKITIDAKGLACPQPVILARKKMSECGDIEVLVDNPAAVENLTRLANNSGWNVSSSGSEGIFSVIMKGNVVSPECGVSIGSEKLKVSDDSYIVVLSSEVMGSGDNDLGAILMKAFIHTLAASEKMPASVLFYNAGVKLAAEGSDVLDDLAVIEKSGAELLVCGTCANFFQLGSMIKAGKISNMYDILEKMKKHSCIIRP